MTSTKDTVQQRQQYGIRWVSEHGPPQLLRVDSEGAFRAFSLQDRCSDLNIELEMTAGEGHWQLGVTEKVIQDIDGTMHKLQDARPDLLQKNY